MLKLKHSTQFKSDIKKVIHQKNEMTLFKEVVELLLEQKKLPEKNSDHPLKGQWSHHRECHVKPDLLLIYKTDKEYLYLERIGSHSELFR